MIEILHYEKVNKNKVIGYVDIKISLEKFCVIIRRIAHLQSGDKKWFNLPNFRRDKADGTPNYLKYFQFEQEAHNGQLMNSLAEKVKEFCEKNNIKEAEPIFFERKMDAEYQGLPF